MERTWIHSEAAKRTTSAAEQSSVLDRGRLRGRSTLRFNVHEGWRLARVRSRAVRPPLAVLSRDPRATYSQSPFISHPPEEQVSLPCCTVAFEYVCSPLVRSRTY